MAKCNEHNAGQMLDFLLNTPCEQEIVDMDCNDYCNHLARLAEMVANGASLDSVRPELEKHMAHWKDCREEFEALVAILKAEQSGEAQLELPSQPE